MLVESYYVGYQLGVGRGEGSAAAVLRIAETPQGRVAHWAAARSSVAGALPYDALLDCLARLGVAQTGPKVTVAVVRGSCALDEQALEQLAALYPRLTETTERLPALAACEVFLAAPARPAAVVVADSGILVGAVDARGLQVALRVEPPDEASPPAAPRGPWPLVEELERAGAWPVAAELGAPRAGACTLPSQLSRSTQHGLTRGYVELQEWLRQELARADAAARRAAAASVQRIVSRDLAVLERTARHTYPGAQLCLTGRLANTGATASLCLGEQLALGAAVLASWQALGATVLEAREAPRVSSLPVSEPAPAAPAVSALESFAGLFASREQREQFLTESWGRASLHLPQLIEPHALFSGDEFLAGLRRACEAGPAQLRGSGAPQVNMLRDGVLQPLAEGKLPYPVQWQAAPGWRQAHLALAASERAGCSPWELTLRLTSVHHVCPRLTPLLLSFFEFFSSHCWVNAYYSPPRGVRGLAYHADGTDVFVLQIEGEKHWAFDAAPLGTAAERQLYTRRVNAGELEPERRRVLRPGDLLYLPAGTCHAALATTSPSLHLTFAVRRHTALRVRQWWAKRCAGAEVLNQSVQRYDTVSGTVGLDEAAARAYLAAALQSSSAAALLADYQQDNLRCDREATLQGQLLASIDHV